MPIIQSVQRALQILELFDEHKTELRISEISIATGLHKSTLHSLLKTLQAAGYIDQNAENGRYRLGLKLIERGSLVVNSIDMRKRANPMLVELSRQTGQTAHLGILDGCNGVYIDKVEGPGMLIAYSRIGRQLPIHCTAIGKSLLSKTDRKDVAELLKDYVFEKYTPHTIGNMDDFIAELNRVAEEGVARDEEEHSFGVRCIGAPVFDHTGTVVAAISISTLTSTTSVEDIATYPAAVRKTAATISQALGFKGADVALHP
ncbi:IclR family transcriptional regulator [Breoghania corrubedonensis]|uniref:IclR family transcriptional regulator n=1 Tax=Breoghania corrubedonensis TaxID=665038 RepID=A0A2T5V5F4_9HYPH|nr:IclR family transcriptional regulator [Breoghania corrubedonensis]PTW58970.1 IclR family transcriptional regulator [Breoghania corrubedonensis]